MIPVDASVLRIYVNADERWQGRPLYQALVEKARSLGLAGASVFNVDISYGAHRRLHDQWSEYLFASVPVVIEIVDGPREIDRFCSEAGSMVREGLMVVTSARVVRYAHPAEARQNGG
jgi:PII-like signaling protein